MKVFAGLLTPVLLLVTSSAAAGRPITHEDVWLMTRVGTPVLSPDGRLVVFSVAEPAYEKDDEVSDLWIVPADGTAAARRLTATPGGESDVAWSHDGSRIAFAAKRGDDEESQIYILDMTGPGEAWRATSLATGASRPRWSPDGTHLAFESRVYPGAADDEANREEKEAREERDYDASAYDGFPIRQWDHWRDDRRTHLFVQSVSPPGEARDLLAGTALAGEPGFSGPPTRSADSLQAEWAPDGRSLVFVATTNRHEAARAFTRYRLYRLSLEEGTEPEAITRNTATFEEPRFSPDGTALYAVTEELGEYAYNPTRLVRFSWPGCDGPEAVVEGFDRPVGGFALAPDGKRVFLLAPDAGRSRIFSAGPGGGKTSPVHPESRGVYAGLSSPRTGESALVARWEDSTHPPEIVRVNPESGEHTVLTSFNVERAAGIDWQPYREMWFTSSKGRRIHSWLTLPPGFDESRKYPLLLMIHGGPHATSLDAGHVRWHPQLMAAPGYVVLATDYTGSVGYGKAFARAIQGDPLRTPGEELLEAADAAIEQFGFIDASRQAALGASYGGHLINWLQATTSRFRCLVGHAGLVSLEGQWSTSDVIYHREINNGGPPWEGGSTWSEQSPARYADRFQTPVLLTIGERDYRVPLNQTLAAWAYLQRRQVPSRLIVFHGANHWIMDGGDARYFWDEVHAWLARHLKE